MNIHDMCIEIVREYCMSRGRASVIDSICELRLMQKKDFAHVVADRTWLFNFIVYRPTLRCRPDGLYLSEALAREEITEEDIWRWIGDEIYK